jgi:3',5'-cyclic AMP phosphodiesterase CpdA
MEFPKKDPIVTFLFIDTNSHRTQIDPKTGQPKPSLSHAEEAEQWKWIEKELSSKRAAWTIVVGHHPVYSNGQHGDTKELVEKLAPMLAKHNVPLYLCGHDHDMQHLELEGVKTSFVVSGGGGAKVRELKTPDRKLGLYGEGVNGFSHLQINAQRMVIRHMDPSGKQIHAFEKKPDGSFSIMNA